MSENDRITIQFSLSISGRELEASARVPQSPASATDLLPVFHGIANMVVASAEADVADEGKKISCRAGCGACCRQLVPISEMEARYLGALVESMPEERRARVVERFRSAVATFEKIGLFDQLARIRHFTPEQRFEIGVKYFKEGVPCPFLEDESCSIHPYRPTSCREYLVTSPAQNCATLKFGEIEMVPLAFKTSVALYHFTDGKGEKVLRYVPLVWALEWAARHRDDPQPLVPGPQMVLNFLNILAQLPPGTPPPHPPMPEDPAA